MVECKNCFGYVHGHDHSWYTRALRPSNAQWGTRAVKRTLCLPSTGHWGDIGYVLVRANADGVRAELQIFDRFYPDPSARTPIDRDLLAEKRGLFMNFRFNNEF